MRVLLNGKRSRFLIEWFPLLITPVYVIVFYINTLHQYSYSYFLIFGSICVLIVLSNYIKNKTLEEHAQNKQNERYFPPDAIQIVFISIYSILAGFAFQEIIRTYGGLLIGHGFNVDLTLRLLSFFLIVVPFYYGGIVSLISSYTKNNKSKSQQRWSLILSFCVFTTTFIVSLFLNLMTIAFTDFSLFTIFIMVILLMSYIWLSFKNRLYVNAGN